MLLTFGDNFEHETKLSPSPGKLLVTKCGNVTVKIYAGKKRVNGTNYHQFTLA